MATKKAARPHAIRSRSRAASSAQVLVRLSPDEARFLDSLAGTPRERAATVRRLLAAERARRERAEMAQMFAHAAAGRTEAERAQDRAERRAIARGFANHD